MKKIGYLLSISVFWALLAFNSYSSVIIGKVVDVHDGDTITVSDGKYIYKVRLLGIDSPETSRNAKFKKDISKAYENKQVNIFRYIPPSTLIELGQEAKRALRNIILGKTVKVEITRTDRYNRNLGWVYLDGMLVNAYMVEKGLARPYMIGLGGNYILILQAERKAKQNKVGIYRYVN
ncbi:MAG: thermonuclease family protein [Brevinematia bacterium]